MNRSQAISAGLLMYRKSERGLEFFLVHPGGPFWKNKDTGAWTIPKGRVAETDATETPFDAAQREFAEETGFAVSGPFIELGSIRQKGGKTVHAWAFEGECDPASLHSNMMQMEWPPRSGKYSSVPEVDKGAYFTLEQAKLKINQAQVAFLERLCAIVQQSA